ncbi:hypothetical protein KIW84_073823 [Lathyrus oleraceus]|uniref:Uncharacterized protein n=1 Tax=Pisum sativum TaxID=3888 RepID=A0A9D4VR25_PEA|nr:hypothetical protein KIW84_073823 [Pisum sativum]
MLLQLEEVDDLTHNEKKIVMEGKREDEETHHLPLNAMRGSHGVETIRFTVQVGSIRVKILVDGGSSDNFIQPGAVQVLTLSMELVPNLRVLVESTWLATLGPHVDDYVALTLKFFQNGQFITLQDVLDDILKELPTNIGLELAILLDMYALVFTISTSLLPHRAQDHAISLQPSSCPVKVKPYGYPHIQKV